MLIGKRVGPQHGNEIQFTGSDLGGWRVVSLILSLRENRKSLKYHATHEAYLEEVAEAMRHLHEAIVASGLILQLDSPGLGLGRHMMIPDLTDDEFVRQAEVHIYVVEHSLRAVTGEATGFLADISR